MFFSQTPVCQVSASVYGEAGLHSSLLDGSAPPRAPEGREAGRLRGDRKGTNGVSTMGSLQISCFLTGTFWVLPLIYFYIPRSARAYPFYPTYQIHYFCSGPISVDPICPQPTSRVRSPPHGIFPLKTKRPH